MASGVIDAAKENILDAAGGPARLQVMAVLAAILALNTADIGAVSAVARELKDAFHIDNTEFGLLLGIVYFAGAIGTLPMGVLVDRVRRKTVLLVSIALWAVAMIVSGASTSYLYLVLTRLALGAVAAAAWPAVASLTGDFFPANERAEIYGQILAGELAGMGIGFFISGEVSSLLDWRWSFYVLGGLSLVLVWIVWRYLPEPARGTQTWLGVGETDPYAASEEHAGDHRPDDAAASGQSSMVHEIAGWSRIPPRKDLILREDPSGRSWLWIMGYLLRIPSYRLLIIASALAYYFFSGMGAFGMLYFRRHYAVSRGGLSALMIVIGIGALVGVVAGGRITERLLRRGRLDIRVVLPAAALVASVPLFAFGIWTRSPWFGIASLTGGAAVLASAMAPIDAARQDIVHPMLWGRAESGRMLLRSITEGTAPLLFGAMSDWLGGGERGLMWTFFLMLLPVVAASLFIVPGRKAYPRDVATAAASADATSKGGGSRSSRLK